MENRSARRPDPDAARPLAARLWIYQRERFPVARGGQLPKLSPLAAAQESGRETVQTLHCISPLWSIANMVRN